jgi:uncharacterized protein (DUF488 family)
VPRVLFTVGHSTHPLAEFLALLGRHQIEAVADVRRFPGSRKHPHFHRDGLAVSLPQAGVKYHWFEALGGRRAQAAGHSENLGLRNASFRNYADYMATPPFRVAVAELLDLARQKRSAVMCAEGLYWRCHRRLIGDTVVARGWTVLHILPAGGLKPHALTDGARIDGERVSYPPPADGANGLFG